MLLVLRKIGTCYFEICRCPSTGNLVQRFSGRLTHKVNAAKPCFSNFS